MEEILKQIMGELHEFRSEVNQRFDSVDRRFKDVDERFDEVDKRLDGMDKRFDEVDKRLDEIDQRFEEVDKRFDEIDQRFEEVDLRFDEVHHNFADVKQQFDRVNDRLDRLDKGQEEIKEIIRHSITLLTENITEIRIDSRNKYKDVQADVEILYEEMKGIKRKSKKLEQMLRN